MKINDSTFHNFKLGPVMTVPNDLYNMDNAPLNIRYFRFVPPTTANYEWDCYLPDPGKVASTRQYKEIELINTSYTEASSGKMTVIVHEPTMDPLQRARLMIGQQTSPARTFILLPGASVKLKVIKGWGYKPKNWMWIITMSVNLGDT